MTLRIALALLVALIVSAPSERAAAQKAPDAAKAATVAKPAAKKTTAIRTTGRKPKRKASSSVCQGLAKSACGGNASCSWVEPKKSVDTRGRKLVAYCRLKSKPSAITVAMLSLVQTPPT